MATAEKRGKGMPSRLQLKCPKCGEEFAFPRGELEKERMELVAKCDEAKLHLREINKLPRSAHTNQTWRDKTYWARIYEQATARLSEIKNQLKKLSEPVTSDLFNLYRELIKDKYGADVDESVMQWAKDNLEAYRISDLSAHNFYTRAGGEIIRKV